MTNQEFKELTGIEYRWQYGELTDYFIGGETEVYDALATLCNGSEGKSEVLLRLLDAAMLKPLKKLNAVQAAYQEECRCASAMREILYSHFETLPTEIENVAEAYGKKAFCLRALRDGLNLGEALGEYVADLVENK